MKDGIVFEIATGKYPHQMATAAVMQEITENIQPELEAAVPVIRAEFAELMEQNKHLQLVFHRRA